MEQTRDTFLKKCNGKVIFSRKIHSSRLYKGINAVAVSPNTSMTASCLLVRHISTVLLYLHKGMIEVQVAVNHPKKTIYLACNKKIQSLRAVIPSSKRLSDLKLPDIPCSLKREFRHLQKLSLEKQEYKDYKLLVIHIPNSEGQHAETKIVSVVGNDFDYIGGTKRPCTACFLYMQLKGIPCEKYNNHHGACWDSDSALISLKPYINRLHTVELDDCYYYNKGLLPRNQTNYDTDSENEED